MTVVAATTYDLSAVSRGRWAVAALFFVNGFMFGSWAPQIPFMLPRHNITEFTLGLMIFMIGVGAVGAMSWSGWLINHFGSRKVALGFAAGMCLAFPGVVLSQNIPLACLFMVLLGGFGGSMDVAMNANAVEVEKRLDRAIMSSSHGFWSLGGFAGGLAGGPVIQQLGPEWHAIAAAILALVIVAVAAMYLIVEPVHASDSPDKPKYKWPTEPTVYILGLMALFCMVPEGAILDWAALYVQKEFDAPISVAGLAFAFFAGTMAIMRFLGDSVRNRFGAVRTLRVSCLIAAVGMVGGAVAPNEWLVIAAFAFAGLGVANTVPVVFSAAGNQSGLSAGAGISTVTMMGYSGILFAPSLIGFVAEHIGYRVTYFALAALLIVVMLLAQRASAADRT
jgi:MFS family permease